MTDLPLAFRSLRKSPGFFFVAAASLAIAIAAITAVAPLADAAISAIVPAIRVARVDPASSLRAE